jgi:GT2 family glycosyltransferase
MATTFIILVNWNGKHDTIECLESLLRLDDGDFHVVVVDNGSTDGSVDEIEAWAAGSSDAVRTGPVWDRLPTRRRWQPGLQRLQHAEALTTPFSQQARITLIEAGVNLGFAAANNLGMRFAARVPDARFFWILNNDTVPCADALTRLVAHADKSPDQGIIGSTLLYYHRPELVQGVGGWIRPGQAMAGHIGTGLSPDALPSVETVEAELAYVMGASMFVRRDLYDRIGGMSEDYFLYFEELDWAKRLPQGVRQGICLGAVVFHKEGGSIGTSSIDRPSNTSLYYHAVNTVRFYWRFERRHVSIAVLRAAWNIIGYLRQRDRMAAVVTVRAVVDAMTGRRRRGPYNGADFRTRKPFGEERQRQDRQNQPAP